MTGAVETVVNVAIKAPFTSVNDQTGIVSFPDLRILKNGVLTPLSTTYAEIGNGLYVATFTPTSTGIYTFFIEGKIHGIFNVVSKSIYSFLLGLEDAAIGSWAWDKNLGTLTFTRQDGTPLAGFNVIDNLTTASRERTSP